MVINSEPIKRETMEHGMQTKNSKEAFFVNKEIITKPGLGGKWTDGLFQVTRTAWCTMALLRVGASRRRGRDGETETEKKKTCKQRKGDGVSVVESTNRVMSTFQNANFAYLMWPNVMCKQANSAVIICN